MRQINFETQSGINILPFDGEALLYEKFFIAEESDIFLQCLQSEIQWRQEPITIYGRSVLQPRLTALYGDTGKPLRYSGIAMQPFKWTESLLQIKKKIEPLVGKIFTTALLNQYRDGQDSMGWHRDNEKELGPNPVIASVSFGATRKFQFRHYTQKSVKKSVQLSHGSLLIMRGACQHHWQHSISKTKLPLGPRINLTFRVL